MQKKKVWRLSRHYSVFWETARYPISLLRTSLIAFTISSLSQTTYPLSCTCRRLEEASYQFINLDLYMLKRQNHGAKFHKRVIYQDSGGFTERLRLQCVPNQVKLPLLKLFKHF